MDTRREEHGLAELDRGTGRRVSRATCPGHLPQEVSDSHTLSLAPTSSGVNYGREELALTINGGQEYLS